MIRMLTRIVCFSFLAFSLPALAAKTDVVILKNGDKVTGEVKALLRGKLELNTDSMGTVYIEWLDIQAVISDTDQSVELANGQRFFGPLRKSENTDMVSVETEQGTVGLGVMDVVAMYPVEASFWQRLDIVASLGFNWDKASDVGKYSIAVDAEYRHPDHITRAGLLGELTTQEDQSDTQRANANINHMRFRGGSQFISYFGNLESNDELGLDLRALAGAGYGWIPIRSTNKWFLASVGLDINREIPNDGDTETNIEAVGRVTYEYFRYSNPERDFSTTLTVFPSLTDWGRYRVDFNTQLDIEFYKDFSWILSVWANYDSDPIATDAATSDYGFRSAIAYEW